MMRKSVLFPSWSEQDTEQNVMCSAPRYSYCETNDIARHKKFPFVPCHPKTEMKPISET
jgi:hypothetical protein